MIVLYLIGPSSLDRFNNNFIDMFFNIRGDKAVDERIAIVDIDEKSLSVLGQWPWSRDKVAKILDNLTSAGAGVIGLDMVFAEQDRTGDKHDQTLAQSLAASPTILGFIFNYDKELSKKSPNIPVTYLETTQEGLEVRRDAIPNALGVLPNIDILQNSAYSSGSFNMIPDADGIVRRVPVVLQYKDKIYPSLSFEMVRAAIGEDTVFVEYDNTGVEFVSFGGMSIPTDHHGRVFVNYRGGGFSYPYLSAVNIYNNNFDRADVEGKMILLGTSASGLLDIRSTPFDIAVPGVEIHANMIDNIITGDFLSSPPYLIGINFVLIIFSSFFLAFILSRLSSVLAIITSVVYMILFVVALYMIMIEMLLVLNIIYPILGALLTLIILFFVNYYIESKQKQVILDKFSRKVSPAVANELIASGKLEFEGTVREVTIFFSDVRNFTSISESFESAYHLIEYLNEYMSPMSDIIIESEGTIDKYIGDAIMAYWNAPLDVEDHPDRAVGAAIDQIAALVPLNKKLIQENKPLIDIGIGLHTGEVVVGEMGSYGRSDYTIIGDNVNLGSRIEGLCKPYGAKILISESTKERLKQTYKIRQVDKVTVKGKERPVVLYEVMGRGEFNEDEKAELLRYEIAQELYNSEAYQDAKDAFEQLNNDRPHTLYAMYAVRCQKFIDGELKMVNGVYKYDTK
jgi:adenylate cyclase